MRISNWSGSVQFTPARLETPVDAAQVERLVREAAEKGQTVRTIGSGHSFSPLIETPGLLLNLDRLSGLVERHEDGDYTVRAGTKLWQLNELLFAQRRSMENLGDINRQSIAGSISTGTHGTGLSLGSISTQVRALELVTGAGERLRCSPTEQPDVFKAAQVSLGVLGIVTEIRLRTLPAYALRLDQTRGSVRDCLARAMEYGRENRHFEFFSFPYSDHVQLKLANPVQDFEPPGAVSTFVNEVLLENVTFKLLSMIARAIPALAPAISRLCGAAVSGRVKADWAHQIFSTPRWVRFQEMEYSVPAEKMGEVVAELREMIEKKRIAVHFPIECRFVKSDDVWLSPAYGRDSAYIAIHMYKGMEYRPYFDAAESIFLNQGGRPHWGKMNFLEPARFPKLYPQWEAFQSVRRRLDPHGIFLNARMRALFEPGA